VAFEKPQSTTPAAASAPKKAAAPRVNVVTIPSAITVREFAQLLKVEPVEVIKQLMRNGIMATINQAIDFRTASAIAPAFGFAAREAPAAAAAAPSKVKQVGELTTRPPIVTIMGHVDHGKTSLLDAIRQSNVVATEAGAITQHIGAYQVEVDGRKITFLDTPGHEAFTAMRARGARVTDIAVIVVAADDGVQPQTIEAIDHARAAGVSLVVALNKIDKPNANPEKVKRQLGELGLNLEEWGGDVICVPVSAKKKTGIKDLLENILLVADIMELKANANRPAEGTVVEAELDKSKGPTVTVLVQTGTLKVGDIMVAGNTWGKIRAMFDDLGRSIKQAEPATPAVVLGMKDVPAAGDNFRVVESEKEARAVLDKQRSEQQAAVKPVTLTNLFAQAATGEIKELNIILKTDVQGSIEPIKTSLDKLSTGKIKVKVIRAATGSITEGDVLLALASRGIIIGFNSQPEPGARAMAENEGVSIRTYNIIYDIIDDVTKALEGMLEPEYAEVVEGMAEVRATFPGRNKTRIAGCYIKEGRGSRDAQVRIIRGGKVVRESRVSSLRRFKDDVREVTQGMECGVGVEDFNDFEVGDFIQFYRRQKVS
jgi:translation initiation factor IF-2